MTTSVLVLHLTSRTINCKRKEKKKEHPSGFMTTSVLVLHLIRRTINCKKRKEKKVLDVISSPRFVLLFSLRAGTHAFRVAALHIHTVHTLLSPLGLGPQLQRSHLYARLRTGLRSRGKQELGLRLQYSQQSDCSLYDVDDGVRSLTFV